MCAVPRNVQRHVVQLLAIAADEVLPCPFVSRGACARQRQLFQTQPGAELSFLLRRSVGRIQQKILAQNFIEDGSELPGRHAVSRSPAALVKSGSEICSRAGLGGAWHFTLTCPR